MGLEASSLKGLDSNEYLGRFCGEEALSPFDPIWNKLFSHSIKPVLVREDDFLLDTTLEKLRVNLLQNNLKTKNVSSLIEVFAARAKELQVSVQTSDNIFIWQAYNALFILRTILKSFYSNLTEEECNRHLEKTLGQNGVGNGVVPCTIPEPSDPMELLLESLIYILVELPITNVTYILHVEAVNTLIVILSQQMFVPSKAAIKLPSYRTLMQGSVSALSVSLTNRLLLHYIEQRPPPYPCWNNESAGSIVIGVASGIWNILRKGVGLSPQNDEIMEGLKEHDLAKQSLYLLLVLVNHCTGRSGTTENYVNPYRLALISCHNEAGAGEIQEEPVEGRLSTFRISFSKLYETICEQIDADETTLLLYLLTFENVEFMSYIMARSDIETLVLPMIKTLYNAPMSSTHHIYMSLIILLILSEEDLFNLQIHDISLTNVYWYTERNVGEITLGGLTILVIIRTIQYNILKMRDKYLHTNCLASLANMSSKFRSLHPYVAQRLVSLFETLGKRYLKLLQRVDEIHASGQEQETELTQDVAVLEEVVRMVLEILNSTLSHQLAQNRHLIYTLLYKKDILEPFRSQEATQDLVANLDTVINYFTRRLGKEYHTHTAAQVMEQIEDGVLHWKPDILKKFPELKFRYVEEDSPEAFFVPYVWSLIFQRAGMNWTNVNMELFNLEPEVYS